MSLTNGKSSDVECDVENDVECDVENDVVLITTTATPDSSEDQVRRHSVRVKE